MVKRARRSSTGLGRYRTGHDLDCGNDDLADYLPAGRPQAPDHLPGLRRVVGDQSRAEAPGGRPASGCASRRGPAPALASPTPPATAAAAAARLACTQLRARPVGSGGSRRGRSLSELPTPVREDRPIDAIAGLMAGAAIFAGLIAIAYRPIRVGTPAIGLALVASAIGGRNARLAGAALAIATAAWVVGMIVA